MLLGLAIIPFWTNYLIRTIAWRIVLSPTGFFSNWFQDIGLRDSNLQVLDTRSAVQLAVVYNYLPLMIFPLFVALDRLDPALREASKDLGANRIRTFFQVTLPLAAPGIVAGLLLVFIPLSGDYITAAVLGGAQGNMAGALVATQFLQAQNKALGSAVAMVLIISILVCIAVAALLVFIVRTLLKRRRAVTLVPPGLAQVAADHGHDPHQARQGQDHRGGAAQASPVRHRDPRAGPVVGARVRLLVPADRLRRDPLLHRQPRLHPLGRVHHPLVRTLSRQLQPEDLADELDQGRAHRHAHLRRAGGLAGIALARRPGVWTKGFLAAVFLILVTPEIVDAIGLQIWFVNLGGLFRQGLFPLWIGQSIFSSAVVTLIVRARMAGSMNRSKRPQPTSTRRLHAPSARSPCRWSTPPCWRRAAGFHVQPRQRDHQPVRQRSRLDHLPRLRVLIRAPSHPTRHRRRLGGHARTDVARPRSGRRGAQAFGGLLHRDRRHHHRRGWLTPQPPACPG